MSGLSRARILAIDAGFTAMGIVVAEGDRIVLWDVCRTQRTAAKRGIRVADDDAERAQQLAVRLHNLIVTWNPAGVVVELPHGGAQGARANRAMGIATGVVAAVLAVANMPSEWVTPGDVKKAATGRRDASKDAVQEAVRRRFHWTSWPEMKQDVEHVADAAAAILAAEGGTLIRTLERMREVAG